MLRSQHRFSMSAFGPIRTSGDVRFRAAVERIADIRRKRRNLRERPSTEVGEPQKIFHSSGPASSKRRV
jgi:hypothetical protein